MDAKHQWYRAQRLAIAKTILRCQRVLDAETAAGRRYYTCAQRMQRMIAYYRNRVWFLHIEEQRYYYRG